MSKNSNNVIFTRAQVIREAKIRLNTSGLDLTPKAKNRVLEEIDTLGTKVFDYCKTFITPEQKYVEELRRIEREGSQCEFTAAMMLLESALWLIKIKYEQLKEVLGE